MKHILIFGGTTEGRTLAERLCEEGFACTVCVATEYGEMVMDELPKLTIKKGRMDTEQMQALLETEEFLVVVDATHPFATEVSKNITESIKGSNVPCLRLRRDTKLSDKDKENIVWFSDANRCAKALAKTEGNILLTTGSKELAAFAAEAIKKRLYVRVLPSVESITACEQQGIFAKQIIAMQGPFLEETNKALLRQFQISHVVTKETGLNGGFFEKLRAAQKTNTKVMVIGNPEEEGYGLSFSHTIQKIYELANVSMPKQKMRIAMIGVGMGQDITLTAEAQSKLEQADVVFGAERFIQDIPKEKMSYPYYLAADIIPCINKIREKRQYDGSILKIAILFSGDTGFFSGAKKLSIELRKEMKKHGDSIELSIVPGISSISYLAAKAGISWNNAAIISVHGRKANIYEAVSANELTFILVSGADDMRYIGALFTEKKMTDLTITVGYQLSYTDEEIMKITPLECREFEKTGLYCCFIENKHVKSKCITHGLNDESFIRGQVPMTKEEIRDISICKLKLSKNSVLYDIGSGTGSIAIECARLSEDINVYAIEKKQEAVELIQKNCDKFEIMNVTVVNKEAPGGLENLPVPTHVFIGGSSGKLKDILTYLYKKNQALRVVINAITLETIGKMVDLLEEFSIEKEEIVQVQISRSHKAGTYHLMQAENPVFIFSFNFSKGV